MIMVHSHGELDESNGTVCEGEKKNSFHRRCSVFLSRPCVYYTYTEVWPSTDKRKMRKKTKNKNVVVYKSSSSRPGLFIAPRLRPLLINLIHCLRDVLCTTTTTN